MYKNILIPLENSATDQAILDHIRKLGKIHASNLTLIHVADGFVARNQKLFNLADSEEMIRDREFLEKTREELKHEGFQVETILKCGDPATIILEVAKEQGCDLIAMSTHGHLFFRDFIFGSVATTIRHHANVPVLMLKAPKI